MFVFCDKAHRSFNFSCKEKIFAFLLFSVSDSQQGWRGGGTRRRAEGLCRPLASRPSSRPLPHTDPWLPLVGGRGPHCAPSSILRWAGAPGHCLQELGCLRLQPHALYPELGPSLPKVNLGGEQVASLSGAQCLPLGWGAPQGCCRCRENTGGCCRQCHCHPVGFLVPSNSEAWEPGRCCL